MKNITTVKLLSLMLAIFMLAGSMTLAAFATGDGLGENYSEEDDMTPDILGASYNRDGYKISYLQQFKYADSGEIMPVGSATNAIHGGHHTRILRTEHGTYAVIIYKTLERDGEVVYLTDHGYEPIDLEAVNGPEHPYWYKGINYYAVVKLTPSGVRVILEDSYPENDSSQVPEIYNGENGHFFVIVPGEDAETYAKNLVKYQHGEISDAQFKNAAYLVVHEIDAVTDTEVRTDKAIYDFDTSALDDHGYGKPSGVVDLQARKIYCIYDGGFGGITYPAYFAWFIYDLDTHEWEPTCHTLTIGHRNDYYNIYPEGNGGITFIIQRCVVAEFSPEILGFQISGAGFAWDSVYYYHINDMEEVTFSNDEELDRQLYGYTEYPISVPDYQLSAGKYYPIDSSHYGNNGCTYQDTDGNIHVIYTEKYPKKHPKQSTTTYHSIIDPTTDTEVFHEMIPTSLLPKNGGKSGYDPGMGFTMTQGPDGTFYIFHFTTTGTSVLMEAWTSPANDGRTFTKAFSSQTLKPPGGTSVTGGYPIIGNSRDGSIRDGIIPMIFNSSTGSGATYYYFSVKVPCEHSWGDWEVTTPPTATAPGEETRTCEFCGETETREVEPVAEEIALSASLSLEDSVDINIYVDNVTDEMVSDGYYVEYGPDNENVTQVAFSSAEPVSAGKYRFKVASFNANQLSCNAFFRVYNGAGEEEKFFEYSVRQYCDSVIADPEQPEGLKNVCRALMAYGWYAQERFPEGKGPDFASDPYSDAISAVEALTADDIDSYESSAYCASPVTGVGASLALKSKTELSLFIKGVSELGDFTLTVGGQDWTDYEVVESATKCRVIVKGLRPVDLASQIEWNGEAGNSVSYSPMAYVKYVVTRAMADPNDPDLNVCRALYLYAMAAIDYFTPEP